MVIDIVYFREEKKDNKGGPAVVRNSQKQRFADETLVDKVIDLDKKWVSLGYQVGQLRKQLNSLSKQFGAAKKAGESTEELQKQISDIKTQIETVESEERDTLKQRDDILFTVGNIVIEGVPISNDEEDNAVRASWDGQKLITEQKLANHIDCFAKINGTDTVRGTKCAGGRGYFLTGPGALLNQAIISFAEQFLAKRGYINMQTPFFLEKDVMAKCAQLADYDEQLYKVTGEGSDKYLIATSEQSLCAYYLDEVVNFKTENEKYAHFRNLINAKYPTEKPQGRNDYLTNFEPLTEEEFTNGVILFAGYSSCFRKEVGAHGRDTLGIFRIHQFEKIEQLVLCKPELSVRMHYTMINLARDFYEELGIPYRVVDIVSGALNDAAARKYDLEAWFPASQCYRELVSCSNCTDYQSRNLHIKYQGQNGQNEYVHMLNSTLSATERTLCCIVENYAREDGIEVPKALRPFMMGIEKIPYVSTKAK